jgi:divalent metal cation (Fe/Co/Zn/Cd) transporter
MISVSYTHGLRQAQSTMQEAMQKMGAFSQPLHHLISICTFLATIGLILPGVLGSSTWITPLTSLILSAMLLVSIFFHFKSRVDPKVFVSIILFAFAAFVTYGRWMLVPL